MDLEIHKRFYILYQYFNSLNMKKELNQLIKSVSPEFMIEQYHYVSGENVLHGKSLNIGTVREGIINKILGAVSEKDGEVQGYDGWLHYYPVETKTESLSKSNKFTGTGNFSGLTIEKLNKLQRENPLIAQAGFVGSSIAYLVIFYLRDSNIYENIEGTNINNLSYIKNSGYSSTAWRTSKFKVEYLNDKLASKYCVKDLYNALDRQVKKQK